MKFIPEHGKITIGAYQENDFITITVKDMGVGMPEEKIGQLFKITKNISYQGTNREKKHAWGLSSAKNLWGTMAEKLMLPANKGRVIPFLPCPCLNTFLLFVL